MPQNLGIFDGQVYASGGTAVAMSVGDPTTVDPMIPRPDHPTNNVNSPRLNLLLSCAGWRHEDPLDQLPPLLEPLGIRSIKAGSGEEAAEVIRHYHVHIAVVDLAIPFQKSSAPGCTPTVEAGPRVLQLLRRLDSPPPTVVVRPPQPAMRESARTLAQALREGAFAVLDQPVRLESMLDVLRRILRRHYADMWPA